MFGFAKSGSFALESGGVRHALLVIPRHECLRSYGPSRPISPGELSLRGLSDSNSPFVPPIVCRQNLWDQTGVFRREGLTTYNALTRLRGVTEKPLIRTLPFDWRLWFSTAVSKISPRLGSTPGDSIDAKKRRGIKAVRQKSCAISLLVDCGSSGSRADELCSSAMRIASFAGSRFPLPPPFPIMKSNTYNADSVLEEHRPLGSLGPTSLRSAHPCDRKVSV